MSWHVEKIDGDAVLYQNGIRMQNRSGDEIGPVSEVSSGNNDVLVFKFRGEKTGMRLSRTSFLPTDASSLSATLSSAESNSDFIRLLVDNCSAREFQLKRKCSDNAGGHKTASKLRMPDVQPENMEITEDVKLNEADQETETCFVGKFDVSVMTLSAPPDRLLCRDINRTWVNNIKENIKASPTRTYVTLPCLVDPAQVPHVDNFRKEQLASYTVFTLGGNHLRTALQELLQANEDSHFDSLRQVRVDLYVGLSNLQARRLGSLHNHKTETSNPSLFDKVKLCRRILFEMNGLDMDTDETPKALPGVWKSRCRLEMAEEHKTIDSLNTVFHMAQYSARCWDMLCQILPPMYSSGKVIGQTAFQHLQGISEEYRYDLLLKVKGGMTIDQAGREARNTKKMERIRSTFNFLTKSSSWDQAQENFPEHTDESTLKRKFLDMKWDRKTIPDEFAFYCREAEENRRAVLGTGDITCDLKLYKDGEPIPQAVTEKVMQNCASAVTAIKEEAKRQVLLSGCFSGDSA